MQLTNRAEVHCAAVVAVASSDATVCKCDASTRCCSREAIATHSAIAPVVSCVKLAHRTRQRVTGGETIAGPVDACPLADEASAAAIPVVAVEGCTCRVGCCVCACHHVERASPAGRGVQAGRCRVHAPVITDAVACPVFAHTTNNRRWRAGLRAFSDCAKALCMTVTSVTRHK